MSITNIRSDKAFGFVASSLTNGNLLVSNSDGEHWTEWQLCSVIASCSIMVPTLDPAVALIGSRDGRVLRVDITTGLEDVVWEKAEPYYVEVPRFHQSVRDPNVSYAVTVGFDTAKRAHGLLRSTNSGMSFEGHAFAGVSFWAIDERQSNGDLILGGFSEFSHFPGAGLLYMYSVRTGVISTLSLGSRWENSKPSCWDLAITQESTDSLAFLVATESGIYLVMSSD